MSDIPVILMLAACSVGIIAIGAMLKVIILDILHLTTLLRSIDKHLEQLELEPVEGKRQHTHIENPSTNEAGDLINDLFTGKELP